MSSSLPWRGGGAGAVEGGAAGDCFSLISVDTEERSRGEGGQGEVRGRRRNCWTVEVAIFRLRRCLRACAFVVA